MAEAPSDNAVPSGSLPINALSVPSNAALVAIGEQHAIDKIGFCSAETFTDVRAALHERKAAGLSADMAFTYRNPDRSTDPSRSVEGARSIVVGARSYRRTKAVSQPENPAPGNPESGNPESGNSELTGPGAAEIAEYVWEPHYAELRVGLEAIAEHLRDAGWKARVLIDDNALVDRAAAYRAGIGWWGKNSNILVPGVGSKFVLGSVVTDAPLEVNVEPLADQCGPCRRCIDACPTNAIVDDGVIDANRCLAWLVQSPGSFPIEFRKALGGRIYGCDDCQTSCPPNVVAERQDGGPPTSGETSVLVSELLSLDDEALMDAFGAWYIPRREPRYLRRNALVVLGNIGDPESPLVRDLIATYVASDDDIEREHAQWAGAELGIL